RPTFRCFPREQGEGACSTRTTTQTTTRPPRTPASATESARAGPPLLSTERLQAVLGFGSQGRKRRISATPMHAATRAAVAAIPAHRHGKPLPPVAVSGVPSCTCFDSAESRWIQRLFRSRACFFAENSSKTPLHGLDRVLR